MYIFEVFCKIFSKIKKTPKDDDEFPVIDENDTLGVKPIEDYESCEHTFMPVDSTNEILACTKCGILKKRSELKNKNFFMQK